MATYQIYAHINKINHKVYVGLTSAVHPNNRWHGGSGYQKNDRFYLEIKQYGWENFEHLILETNIPESQVDERERYWIAYYNATDPEKGYNKLNGGRHGGQMSEESKQKVKDSWTEDRRKAKSDEMKLRWVQDGEQLRQEKRELMIYLNKTLDRSGDNNGKSNLGKFGAEAHRAKKLYVNKQERFLVVLSKRLNGQTMANLLLNLILAQFAKELENTQENIRLHKNPYLGNIIMIKEKIDGRSKLYSTN